MKSAGRLPVVLQSFILKISNAFDLKNIYIKYKHGALCKNSNHKCNYGGYTNLRVGGQTLN